jgi:hypothetical protein
MDGPAFRSLSIHLFLCSLLEPSGGKSPTYSHGVYRTLVLQNFKALSYRLAASQRSAFQLECEIRATPGGSAARAENGGIPLSPPDLSRRDKGLLFVLLIDLHNGTAATENV